MLEKKNILVVGAAGGIGCEVVKECCREGANVFAGYCKSEDEVKSVEGVKAIFIDLTCRESIQNAVSIILEENKQIHGLVNCAGVHIAGPLLAQKAEEIVQQMQINLLGAIFLTQQIIKNMVRNRGGSIIHLGSVAAHRMVRGHSVYSATKAGLEGFSKALAAEVAQRGIRVNCVLPGPVMTKMLQKTIEETGDQPQERIPMKRLITATEVAQLVCFLLSDKASTITGTTIPIDGGYLLW